MRFDRRPIQRLDLRALHRDVHDSRLTPQRERFAAQPRQRVVDEDRKPAMYGKSPNSPG
jgi:hypothetical protein